MRLGINLHFFFELYFQTMAAVLVRFEAGQNPVLKDIYLQLLCGGAAHQKVSFCHLSVFKCN